MGTAYNGTFVISWSQTTIDTLQSAPVDFLKVGVTWGWEGEAVRVDGPNDLLRLDDAEGEADRRKRAARMVRRLVGAAIEQTNDLTSVSIDHPVGSSLRRKKFLLIALSRYISLSQSTNNLS